MMELHGVKKEMRLTAARHPGIELLEFDEEAVQKLRWFWECEEAEKKRKIWHAPVLCLSRQGGNGDGH